MKRQLKSIVKWQPKWFMIQPKWPVRKPGQIEQTDQRFGWANGNAEDVEADADWMNNSLKFPSELRVDGGGGIEWNRIIERMKSKVMNDSDI